MDIEKLKKRLLKNSVVDPETGCWVWCGKISSSGYGQLTVRILEKSYPVNLYVHRLAVVIFQGKRLRDDCHVDHICRNTLCINPEHVRQVRARTNLTRRRYAKTATCCARCGQSHLVNHPCVIGN